MLTSTDIAQVLSFYDLGQSYRVTQVGRGHVNETVIVQTTEGRFVVRRNHRGVGEAAQRYRHQLIKQLHEQGVPVPALIPNRNGDTLLSLDGRFYEVMQFVVGEDYKADNPLQQENIGATLARYHLAVQDMPAPPKETTQRYSPQGILALNEIIIKQDMMGDLTHMTSWYDLRAAKLRAKLPSKGYEALPHLVIHGDIHRDNFIFAGDEVAAMIDFDQVAWDTPLADLADALVAFASIDRPHVLGWGVFNGPLHEERAMHLIAGYTSVHPLSQHDLELVLVLLEVMWLDGELGRVVSTPEGAPDYHESVLQQGQELSTWLEKNHDRLLEQWTKTVEQVKLNSRVTATAA